MLIPPSSSLQRLKNIMFRKEKKRSIIAYVHKQLQKIEQAKASGNVEEAATLQANVKKLGGLAAYQHFSLKSEGKFNTSRIVLSFLTKHGIIPSQKLLKLLDVGALAENYADQRQYLDATAIDIHSNNPFVKEMDFFDFPLPFNKGNDFIQLSEAKERVVRKAKNINRDIDGDDVDDRDEEHEARLLHSKYFDVVCLCLVVNFVGDASKRGSMLFKTTLHMKEGGHLALVLPLACTENSRYYNSHLLEDLCIALGYSLVEKQQSARLISWLFRLNKPIRNKRQVSQLLDKYSSTNKKVVVRKGGKRNNFFISVDISLCSSMLAST
eukprot:m.128412 g.128412  ORF g.128412 m.128412 type:complete len:325 (+) comp9452_c3_seq1:323-1297(+)